MIMTICFYVFGREQAVYGDTELSSGDIIEKNLGNSN